MANPKKHKQGKKLNNSLRIIGGEWRGRKFSFPSLPGLRPTSDRVRETLFNWLSPVIHGSNCLDLFTGSGALGLEALSRGASHATMVDTSNQATRSLEQHLTSLNCASASLFNTDAIRWLNQPASNAPFNIVFLDPPFQQDLISPCCKLLNENQLLHAGSYIYIESERSLKINIPSSWQPYRQKTAGEVAYYLYIKEQ